MARKVGGKGLTRLTVTGVAELVAKMKKLPGETRKKVLAKAFKAGATAVKRIMKQEAPKGPTGNLKKAIVVKKMKGKGVAYAVRPKYSVAPHAHLVEFGTGMRTVKNYFGQKGMRVEVGVMPANPFVTRTKERSKTEAFNVVVKESKPRIKLLASKGGK